MNISIPKLTLRPLGHAPDSFQFTTYTVLLKWLFCSLEGCDIHHSLYDWLLDVCCSASGSNLQQGTLRVIYIMSDQKISIFSRRHTKINNIYIVCKNLAICEILKPLFSVGDKAIGFVFTQKMPHYVYRNPHYKAKTVWRPPQVYNGNAHSNKTVSS